MAKRTTRRKKVKNPSLNGLGIGFVAVGFLSLFKLGFLGNLLANSLRLFVGDTYWIAAILCLVIGGYLFAYGKTPTFKRNKLIGASITYTGLLVFLDVMLFHSMDVNSHYSRVIWQLLVQDFQRNNVTEHIGGGLIGTWIYSFSVFLLSPIGTGILAVAIMLIGLLVFFEIPFSTVVKQTKSFFAYFSHFQKNVNQTINRFSKRIQARKVAKKSTVPHSDFEGNPSETNDESDDKQPVEEFVINGPVSTVDSAIKDSDVPSESDRAKQIQESKPREETNEQTEPETQIEINPEPMGDLSDYVLPSSDLLTKVPETDQSQEYKLIKKNQQKLSETFKSFGVNVNVKSASLGPSVTEYEVQPATGVKVSKIVNLADDLALALAAKDIRIEAPIPGKSLVGIEVPNQTVSVVSFRDVIEHQSAHNGKLLEVPLGKDVNGKVISSDLSKMPHLLIAGSTGSGKSVAINTILTSILMNAKPDEVKLMLIDPKRVELNVYNGIPHLLIPVVTDAKKAAGALGKAVQEMERRYELFANTGFRNMKEYNDAVRRQNEDHGTNQPLLPYIVIVVDELADLMMVAGNEVESAIIRLAQMARAAGIHMIIATQRPSVDVITGLIKANIPSRIAFAVSSGIDSRTILDSSGAEKLLGRGDMLYLPMGLNKPIRIQGAYIDSKDVEAIVAATKEQETAHYDESMIPTVSETNDDDEPEDEYYNDAVALVIQQKSASVSLLQRRFRIGYNRAARLVDALESHGVVGPARGSKPRQVLIEELPDDSDPKSEE